MRLGKYQLVRKLATGGMAEVFLAKAAGAMGFEKEVVVKRILPHLAEEDGFVEMLFTEARIAARLNHPHIVQIFDFGEAEGTYYLAMEYIDGLDLRSLMKRVIAHHLALSPVFCAWVIATACEGLAFAHELRDPATGKPVGLIHRDVSLDNILLSRQGGLKIVDFGIAKAADQSPSTRAGIIKGKLSYMAPEQLLGQPLDRRVDVYALGVVFYELLTGRKPFNATTQSAMTKAILHEAPVPAVQRRPDLPEVVSRILDRALAKDREHRYPDCLAFQSDLEDYIQASGQKLGVHRIVQCITQMLALTAKTPPPQSFLPSAPQKTLTAPPPPRIAPLVPLKPSPTNEVVTRPRKPPRTEPQAPPVLSPSPPELQAKPHQRTGWRWALACVGLLLAGGGLLAWKLGGEQPPAAPPSPPAMKAPPH
jgi:serine/threonine-protein kinase